MLNYVVDAKSIFLFDIFFNDLFIELESKVSSNDLFELTTRGL